LTGRRKGTCGLARVAARHKFYAQLLHDLHDSWRPATNGV